MMLEVEQTREKLFKRILVLNSTVWENRVPESKIKDWLNNFSGEIADAETEQLHALFWLSQFMYFGNREIRVLLKAAYRDLFLCPLIRELRESNPSANQAELEIILEDELAHTKFLGVGNPSESGVHLLYYFRQENNLKKEDFMDTVEIFAKEYSGSSVTQIVASSKVRRYVFLDDICGSGETATKYSQIILEDLLRLKPDVKVAYYSLFASSIGLDQVRRNTLYRENCGAVFELDNTYRCLSFKSRFLDRKTFPAILSRLIARLVPFRYGSILAPDASVGYKGGQMLLGFHHNTPDNTITVMWHDNIAHGGSRNWVPIFRRYPKNSSESL